MLALRGATNGCRPSRSTARRSCARPRWRRWPRSPSPRRATRWRTSCAAACSRSCAPGASRRSETARRAARLGCDLSRGAVALVAEVRSSRPRHAAALISSEHRARSPSRSRDRIYAILPARGGDDAPERTQAAARALARRLAPHGPAAYSSFCADPGELAARSRRGGADARGDRRATSAWPSSSSRGSGTASTGCCSAPWPPTPTRCGASTSDTVEPLVAHDRQYRTDLLGNARGLPRQRLQHERDRARGLRPPPHGRPPPRPRQGADRSRPGLGEDRERLGLGIKAYRIIAPTLPR